MPNFRLEGEDVEPAHIARALPSGKLYSMSICLSFSLRLRIEGFDDWNTRTESLARKTVEQ
jgi:hypothetical protein